MGQSTRVNLADRLNFFARMCRGLRCKLRGGFTERVEAAQTQLLDFGRKSDEAFNSLADGLFQLHAGLDQLRKKMEPVHEILEQARTGEATAAAFAFYQRSIAGLETSMALAITEARHLEELEDSLCEDAKSFFKNSHTYRVLTTCIRMEAARQTPENQSIFMTVAQEIASMDLAMREMTQKALTDIQSVGQRAETHRLKLEQQRSRLTSHAEESNQLFQREWTKIKNALEPCFEAKQEAERVLGQTKQKTSSIITAMQFQDIVRQQVEHIALGFKDMIYYLEETFSLEQGYFSQTAKLQLQQLKNSRSHFTRATKEIGAGMETLLTNATELLRLFASFETRASSVFQESQLAAVFRVQLEHLSEITREVEQESELVSRLMAKIETTVRTYSSEIERQEFEVKLVALNAQIAASQLASDGALNTLTEETSRISVTTAELTQKMTGLLQQSMKELQVINQKDEALRADIVLERSKLSEMAEKVSAELSHFNDSIQTNSGQLSQEFRVMYEQVKSVMIQPKFPEMIAACFDPAETLCEQLISVMQASSSSHLSKDAQDRLTAHQKRYTMHTERDVHSETLGHAATSPAEKSTVSDIDFFDSPIAVSVEAESTSSIELF